MPTNTLALLRTAAKQEADKENDAHIGDPEWNRRVNEGYRSLWNLIRSENEDYFVTSAGAAIVDPNINILDFPLLNGRLRQLWYKTGAGPDDYERVRRWNMEETPHERVYKVIGATDVYVYPASMSVGTYLMWVESDYGDLVLDADTIYQPLEDWAEYIYLYAALGGKGKEEADPSLLGQRLARLEKEILAIVHDLDVSEPARVVNVWPPREWRPPPLPRP